MNKNILLATAFMSLALTGCASMKMAPADAPAEFTYDYTLEGKSKDQLYDVAVYYFAEKYNNSGSVVRVSDKENGVIYGKGVSTWNLLGNICSTAHEFRFAAKDGKARLQYELIRGVPSSSACGWDWPTESGYQEVVSEFNDFSVGLEKALKTGETKQGFMDF